MCEGGVVDAQTRRDRFEEIAPALIEPLRRFLARRTDPATADDVLSETLLVCWRRLEELPAEPLPWAYGVARNCLANAERGVRRQERVAAKVAVLDRPAESTAGPGQGDDLLSDAMAALRPDDAELLRLWAWEQLTPGRDRRGPRHHPQRRQHPAAPRPREVAGRAAKDRAARRT